MTKTNLNLLAFYDAQRTNFFLTGITKWWWFPDESGDTTLVVSVRSSDTTIWLVAYTILVTLIFMAACDLATAIVLTTFRLGTSGNRHAILVAYYNGGSPSRTIKPMFGYIQNALLRCKKQGAWTVDRDAFWASFGLLLLTVALITGDVATKFFLGGSGLIIANVAQANPGAVFYPRVPDGSGINNGVTAEDINAFRGFIPPAIYQANARMTNAEERLKERIKFSSELIENGTLLPDGSRQNGTGARFTYQYTLNGYEMGLRDAPELEYNVQGACATYHGSDGINPYSFTSPTNINVTEELDIYSYFEDSSPENSTLVYINREKYSAPFAQFMYTFDNNENRNLLEQYGEYRFMIAPHTAWRESHQPSTSPDPWYETEENPAFSQGYDMYSAYRVKRYRPPLRCSQNDTYTYKRKTVNHVDKLPMLSGLNSTLSPFLMEVVFGREFGVPVFSKLLGHLPLSTLASIAYYDAKGGLLDATRASLEDDFRGLVQMSFVYSREVVRNTVLLYSGLEATNDTLGNVAQDNTYKGQADFFLEGTEVAAMSVFVMVVTPTVCVFLWLLYFLWDKCLNPTSAVDNESAKARHDLRLYGLQAVHLFRYLDEALSQNRKWSGRDTNTPYIRNLDDAPLPVPGSSPFPKPKVQLAQGPPETPAESFLGRVWNKIITCIRGSRQETSRQTFEVVMTTAWDPKVAPTTWEYIRRDA